MSAEERWICSYPLKACAFGSISLPDGELAEMCNSWCLCSFSTSDDTKEYLSKSHAELINEPDVELVQNKSPKVDAATLEPATYPEDPEQEW